MERMNLASVDLNLLVALERLLARRSVTAAAADLGVTQSAMSRTLDRLRDLFEDPLLVRVGRGLVATDRAMSLEAPVGVALRAVRHALTPPAPFDAATDRGDFVVAIGDDLEQALADRIVAALWAAAPGVDLRFRSLGMHTIDEARRGLVDVAVTPDLSALPPSAGAVDLSEFVHRPLYRRRFVLAARTDPPADLDAYVAAHHVIVSFEAKGRGFVDDLLDGLGRRRRVAASVTTFPAMARLVAATHLVGLMPAEVAALVPSIRTAAPPFDVADVPIELVWHPRHTSDARHRFLRDVVADAVRAAAGCG
jgi:DNA-binding transcriptional LysR family regulator